MKRDVKKMSYLCLLLFFQTVCANNTPLLWLMLQMCLYVQINLTVFGHRKESHYSLPVKCYFMVCKECMHGWDSPKLKVSTWRTLHLPQSLFPGSTLRWSTGGGDYCSSSHGMALQRKTAIYCREVEGTWVMSPASMSNLQRSVWPISLRPTWMEQSQDQWSQSAGGAGVVVRM